MLTATSPPEAPREPSRVQASDSGVIEIELANGRGVRLSGPAGLKALERLIAVLEGARGGKADASSGR